MLKLLQGLLLALILILFSACFSSSKPSIQQLPKTGVIFRIQTLNYGNKITVSTEQGRFVNFNVKHLDADLFIGQRVKFIIKNNKIIGIRSAALPVY